MNYLLDTNIISEYFKKQPHPRVSEWFQRAAESQLFLSVLTLGEILKGIENIRRANPERALAHEQHLEWVRIHYHDRILPVDEDIALEWGRMSVAEPTHSVDRLLAATAKLRRMTLVTRNVRHVCMHDVSVLNPFETEI